MKNCDNAPLAGVSLISASALVNATQQCILKFASAHQHMPAPQLLLCRVAVVQSFVIMAMCFRGIPVLPESKQLWPFVFGRGMAGAFNMILAGFCTVLLPLGDAQVMQDLHPIATSVVARLYLNEAMIRTLPLSLIVSTVGTVLIAQPSTLFGQQSGASDDNITLGYVFGLGTSIAMAASFVMARRAKNAHMLQLMFWLNSCQILIAIGSLYVTQETLVPLSPTSCVFIVLLSVVNMAYLCTNVLGSQLASASVASFLASTDIVWAYCLQILVFHNHPSTMTLCGVACVVVAISVLAWGSQPQVQSQSITAGRCGSSSKDAVQPFLPNSDGAGLLAGA